ncbi:MAG: hypothetical protein V7L22_33255 [Nostoc sp.]|uniref:DUF6888 family protein n=1 Tax=Nostoc sp. TaxID=1180 RepID=UPI003B5E48E4
MARIKHFPENLKFYIKGAAILPTTAYLPINIVRLDERTGNIFILAGNEIEILISRDINWRYL